MPELVDLLAALVAVRMAHHEAHWKARGPSAYADHELFARLYKGMDAEVDDLAEKIVGLFGPAAVAAADLLQGAARVLSLHPTPEPVARALLLEAHVEALLGRASRAARARGVDTLGLDDLLGSIAHAHETHVYLLRARAGGGA